MSRVVRRKHVLKEMMEDDFELPQGDQQIVRVVSSRGNNLHEVEAANAPKGEYFLVSMPNKFRKNMWVKRGDFVLVEPIGEGDKVKAEICKILTPEHIKEYTKAGVWPKCFTKKRVHEDDYNSSDDSATKEGFVVRNMNRQVTKPDNSDDEETSDDE